LASPRRSRRLRKAAVTAGLMVIFAAVAVLRPFPLPGPGGAPYGTVEKVFDGDTVLLADGRKVRYIGIDSPELDSADPRKRALAEEAREFNRSLVSGRRVELEFDSEGQDKYGRTLAYVYIDGEFVNGRMVAEGLARARFYGDNERHLPRLRELEREAREKGLGIWAPTP